MYYFRIMNRMGKKTFGIDPSIKKILKNHSF